MKDAYAVLLRAIVQTVLYGCELKMKEELPANLKHRWFEYFDVENVVACPESSYVDSKGKHQVVDPYLLVMTNGFFFCEPCGKDERGACPVFVPENNLAVWGGIDGFLAAFREEFSRQLALKAAL